MELSPSALIGLARSPHGKKVIRYSLVSVVSVIVSQVVLIFAFGALHWTARSANVLACTVATVPSYELNRSWVWGKTSKSHLWKEVVPFWVMSFIGLVFSTVVVSLATDWWKDTTLVVQGANLAAFGILWVGKFLILHYVLFKDEPQAVEHFG